MLFNINNVPVKYWNDKTKIEYLQRLIIIHSIIYYELNDSCITDKEFDEISKQLLEFMKNNKKEVLEKTTYWYVFKDFEGITGYYIFNRLNKKDKKYLLHISRVVLRNYKQSV